MSPARTPRTTGRRRLDRLRQRDRLAWTLGGRNGHLLVSRVGKLYQSDSRSHSLTSSPRQARAAIEIDS